MQNQRLENLYRRKLVCDLDNARRLPIEHIAKRGVQWFPERPQTQNFDVLEIGPGRGDFLLHRAQTHPEESHLAIEIGKLRYSKLCERVPKLELKNVTIALADARIPLAGDLKNASFQKIFVLFPDPWPRNRHRHKRLLSPEFTRLLCDRLAPDGEFTFATDVEDYAIWVNAHFAKFNDMKNIQGEDNSLAPLPDLIPTFFEEKWKAMGRICRYVRYRRSKG